MARLMRVFLLDDHEIVRRGLRELIEGEDDMEVVGEASTVVEALTRAPLASPDVAVLDVRLPDGNGVEVCRDLLSLMPELRCVMLTSFADDDALYSAILAGASGYVLKDVRGIDLVSAIRRVGAGESLVDPGLSAKVIARMRNEGSAKDELIGRLSSQEQRVLTLVAEGKTNRQIGDALFLAEKTVKNYVSSILMKMGFSRRTEAAVYVTRLKEYGEHPGGNAERP